MTKNSPADDTLVHHLERLAITADDVAKFLSQMHIEGEIHPEALPKAEKLSVSLRDLIHAMLHHPGLEPLAMNRDDVWKQLTVKHGESDDGTVT